MIDLNGWLRKRGFYCHSFLNRDFACQNVHIKSLINHDNRWNPLTLMLFKPPFSPKEINNLQKNVSNSKMMEKEPLQWDICVEKFLYCRDDLHFNSIRLTLVRTWWCFKWPIEFTISANFPAKVSHWRWTEDSPGDKSQTHARWCDNGSMCDLRKGTRDAALGDPIRLVTFKWLAGIAIA